MISICAVLAVRNGAQYLRVLLPNLAEQGIDVAIIDNDSTDESREIYSAFRSKPIISIDQLPFHGVCDLAERLAAKQNVYQTIDHDWVIHHDADEILQNVQPGKTLRDAIEQADREGFNALNFEEFVFLPEPDADYSDKDYHQQLLRYYFFEPRQKRLHRAWKRSIVLDHTHASGHRLRGESVSIFPVNQIMRHYIVLSQAHALSKYLTRIYPQEALNRGWHGNRRNFTEQKLRLPHDTPLLFRLDTYESKQFHRDHPAKKHFWDWEREPGQ